MENIFHSSYAYREICITGIHPFSHPACRKKKAAPRTGKLLKRPSMLVNEIQKFFFLNVPEVMLNISAVECFFNRVSFILDA